MIPALAQLDWYRFLDRAPLPPPSARVLGQLRGKRILVSGAGGSIGSALALRLAELHPEKLILLDFSEGHLFALQNDLTQAGVDAERTQFVLGSVNDAALVEEQFAEYEPSLVFHAAAFKHVPILEAQPLAAIENNVFGTAEILKAAARHAAQCVLLSTDKAVEPVSVLGATKRVAELLTLRQGGVVVRLANVLASSDSVVEIFARQIADGQPITVTSSNARRYFLTIAEAAHLLLEAMDCTEEPAVFAPRLTQASSIADLAQFLASELSPARDVRIEYTQLRPGDKEIEMLWSRGDEAVPVEGSGLVSLTASVADSEVLAQGMKHLRAACHERDITAAIDALRALEPDYSPSEAVLHLARTTRLGVAQ